MKKLILITIAVLAFSCPAFAFNNEDFALHLRKTLGLDTRTDIKVSSFVVPAGFGNLNMVTATLGGAPYPVFISKDEKKYLWGYVVDATLDPDQSRQALIKFKGAHSQGSDKAPVTVVEYSDMQCSHCKSAHQVLKTELYKAYTKDQVRFVFKHFPLTGHEWAEPAAVASECASKQKESFFWDMSDYFFTNQEKITKETIKEKTSEGVTQLKLDKKLFDECMAAGDALRKVKADKSEGSSVGVNSTPAIFINGRNRRGFRDFEDIKVVIEEKLKEIKK